MGTWTGVWRGPHVSLLRLCLLFPTERFSGNRYQVGSH